ncbi:Uncharacterized protein FKW44_005220, partial [Caligus rogercresseyi]
AKSTESSKSSEQGSGQTRPLSKGSPSGNKADAKKKEADDESALASYFDIGVLRCLYVSYWSEEGVYWALTYFQKK